MALVEILDVTRCQSDLGRLAGSSIDLPQPNSQTDIYEIQIGGWALGNDGPARAIELVDGDRMLQQLALDIPRQGVAKLFPHIPNAQNCGFWTSCGVARLSTEFEIRVDALLGEDACRVELGTIRGRHQLVRSSFKPTLQPVMLTSLGRTGTTWLMQLLSQHPAILAPALYPYEINCARYWIHMFTVLAEPANIRQSAHPDNFDVSPFWVGNHPFHSPWITGDSSLLDWFGRQYVEDIAAFCQRSIENFFIELGRVQKRTNPVYFAEKHTPGQMPRLIWQLYPQAREIFLVRDFRDMLCSILAFNARRGFSSFGREHTPNDEEFILRLRADVQKLLASWRERSDKAFLVRYEDIILRPEPTLEALFAYLDLDRRSSTIHEILKSALTDTQEARQHRTSADATSSIGRWRRELSPKMTKLCDEAFSDLLSDFGYA